MRRRREAANLSGMRVHRLQTCGNRRHTHAALKYDVYWHRKQTIRQGIVIVVVVAFATVVFVGAIRVMTPGTSDQATATTSPTVQTDDDYDDYDDDAASQESAEQPESASE
jgi:hypothetical protein